MTPSPTATSSLQPLRALLKAKLHFFGQVGIGSQLLQGLCSARIPRPHQRTHELHPTRSERGIANQFQHLVYRTLRRRIDNRESESKLHIPTLPGGLPIKKRPEPIPRPRSLWNRQGPSDAFPDLRG